MAVVEAVNHLHGLGREGALAAIERFLEPGTRSTAADARAVPPALYAWSLRGWSRSACGTSALDPRHPDGLSPEPVLLLVRALFVPRTSETPEAIWRGESRRARLRLLDSGYPALSLGEMYPPEPPGLSTARYPLVLVDDHPFLLVRGWTAVGGLDQAKLHLEWARACADLRKGPLQPKGTSQQALGTLLQRLGPEPSFNGAPGRGWGFLRNQAERAERRDSDE